jgi:phage baseplate assembly protein W
MTDQVAIALIAAVPVTIAATASAMIGWNNRTRIAKVETRLDGRLTELLQSVRVSSKAQGAQEEKERAKLV